MSTYRYTLRPPDEPILGLVALQSDQTIERDLRHLLPLDAELYVSRVPSDAVVTSATLGQMDEHLQAAAGMLPPQVSYEVVAYGCTSGTATIGADRIAGQIAAGARTKAVTEPVSALVAACQALSIRRLGILSPYVADVSATLRKALLGNDIQSPVFGSFDEAVEARVVRIDEGSLIQAATDLVDNTQIDALFLSCTNLRTLGVINELEQALKMPVLSSNLVLAWHMAGLSHIPLTKRAPGRLSRTKF